MRLRTSVDVYRAAIWSALGLSQVSACGGATTDGVAIGNNGGFNSAGTGSLGGADASPGGAGGVPTTGGVRTSGGAGGSPGGAGSGGVMTGGVPGSGGASGGSDSGAPQTICRNPEPFLGPNGEPTGLVSCDGPNGAFHRVARVDCPSTVPRPTAPSCQTSVSGDCTADADCTQQSYGHCEPSTRSGLYPPICNCVYGCTRDSECAAGEVCLCGPAVGRCVPSNCTTDADCGGLLCLTAVSTSEPFAFCDTPSFSCQTPADQCTTPSDCSSNLNPCVVMPDGHRACRDTMCGQGGVGRPFIIDGSARLALVACRADWSSALVPDVARLTKREQALLAERWTEIGLMEHASIAANARFVLELLSLCAPPDLVRDAISAAADEDAHARDAFALASAYAGLPVGPGPLDVTRALAAATPADIVRTAIIEGCIGETVAALEAAEALALAEDSAVRAALARAASDEVRHAGLVWRFVQWAFANGDCRLREHVALCFAEAVDAERSSSAFATPSSDPNERLSAHGLLTSATRREIRRRVILEVVEPSARRLVAPQSERAIAHPAPP